MKQRTYFYNANGAAVNEKNGFISIKNESTEELLHRKKLLSADLWRNRKVRPAEVKKGKRAIEELPEIEKAMNKTLKALDKVNAELASRKKNAEAVKGKNVELLNDGS